MKLWLDDMRRVRAAPANEEIEHVIHFGLVDVSSSISAVSTVETELFEIMAPNSGKQFDFRSDYCRN